MVLKNGAEAAGPYASLADAQAAGAVTIKYGAFFNTVIRFIIVAFAIFVLIRSVNAAKKKEEPAPAPATTTRKCAFCTSAVA